MAKRDFRGTRVDPINLAPSPSIYEYSPSRMPRCVEEAARRITVVISPQDINAAAQALIRSGFQYVTEDHLFREAFIRGQVCLAAEYINRQAMLDAQEALRKAGFDVESVAAF